MIDRGAIFHAGSKRRREIVLTGALREEVTRTIESIRRMLLAKRLPEPTTDLRRCRECSLRTICQPEASRELQRSAVAMARTLFDPESV